MIQPITIPMNHPAIKVLALEKVVASLILELLDWKEGEAMRNGEGGIKDSQN